MVAGKRAQSKDAQEWFESRKDVDTAVRRSPDVSSPAYRLWAELAYGWAWYEPSCFPSAPTLAAALGTTERTIFRLLTELEDHGLLSRTRLRHSNKYTLVTEIPPKFLNEVVLDNTKIVQAVKERGLAAFQEPHHEEDHGDCSASHLDAPPHGSDVMNSSGLDPESRCDDFIMADLMNSSCQQRRHDEFIRSDVMNSSGEDDEEKREKEEGENKKEDPCATSSLMGPSGGKTGESGNEGTTGADQTAQSGQPDGKSGPMLPSSPDASDPATSPTAKTHSDQGLTPSMPSSPEKNPQPPSNQKTPPTPSGHARSASADLVTPPTGARKGAKKPFAASESKDQASVEPRGSNAVTETADPLATWAAAHSDIEPVFRIADTRARKKREVLLAKAAERLWAVWREVMPGAAVPTGDGMIQIADDIGEQGAYGYAKMLQALVTIPWSELQAKLNLADPKPEQPGGPSTWDEPSLRDIYSLPKWRRNPIVAAWTRLANGKTVSVPKAQSRDQLANRGDWEDKKPKFIIPTKRK